MPCDSLALGDSFDLAFCRQCQFVYALQHTPEQQHTEDEWDASWSLPDGLQVVTNNMRRRDGDRALRADTHTDKGVINVC